MKLTPKIVGLSIYLLIIIPFITLIIGPPVAAYLHIDNLAKFLYNSAKPFCHQWIYRSFCIFDDNTGIPHIDNCIPSKDSNAIIKTQYTSSKKIGDGKFIYDRKYLGTNRAEVVYRDGMIGYKFGMCSRDTAIYLGMFLALLIYVVIEKKVHDSLPIYYILLGVLPLGIDGVGQLIGLWESNNFTRTITGLITGAMIGVYLLLSITKLFKRNRRASADEIKSPPQSST